MVLVIFTILLIQNTSKSHLYQKDAGYNWTDPSYHLPAFYEIWALYAKDGHEQFYKECADVSREFLHKACHPVTGLNADYTEFSGEPHSTPWMPAGFRYDSWRVPMNIAMDYIWYGKDKKWQEEYAERFQNFLRSKGMDTYDDQFNVDGSTPEFILQAGPVKKLRHSIGLVSTAATASLMNNEKASLDFVHAVWNAKLEPYEDGYFDPYYDGLMHLFSLMHLSGKYQIITPQIKLIELIVINYKKIKKMNYKSLAITYYSCLNKWILFCSDNSNYCCRGLQNFSNNTARKTISSGKF